MTRTEKKYVGKKTERKRQLLSGHGEMWLRSYHVVGAGLAH